MNTDTTYRWFALYTKARAEKKINEELQEKGIEVYLPVRRELRQWSDRKKWIEVPIISSYIFVHIQKDDYRRVFESKGVLSYVSRKGKAVVIPDCEIEAMKRTVESNLTFNVEPKAIRKGQSITITSGPLKGITGKVTDIQGTKKLFLRISHIGYTLVVNLDEEPKKSPEKPKKKKPVKMRAVFFDIDGTLISFKSHSVPASTKKAIHQLRKKGIKVFISTGRAFHDIKNLDDLEFDGFITANGSCCNDPKGEIIVQHLLSKESLEKLASFLEEKPFPCTFMTNDGNFINFTDELSRSVYQHVDLPPPPVKPVVDIIEHKVFQLSAFVDNELETNLLTNILTDCDSSRWHTSFADFNAKKCNKASGMDFFLKHFKIKKEHTMAFGDGGNDIPILKHAAIGVAMGNATDEVKAAANHVTASVDEGGVRKALKFFNIL